MKNAFDGLISRLNMAKEIISEPEDMPIETAKSEMQKVKKKKKKLKKWNIQEMWQNDKTCTMCIIETWERKGWRAGAEEIFEVLIIEFSKIIYRHQSIDSENLENNKQDKYQNNYT